MRISDWSSDVCSSDLFTQKLQRMRLGLDRVGFRIVHPTQHLDRTGLQFQGLALALRWGQSAGGGDRTTGAEAAYLCFVVGQIRRCHDLDGGEARTVAEIDEAQPGLGITPSADPAMDTCLLARRQCNRKSVG